MDDTLKKLVAMRNNRARGLCPFCEKDMSKAENREFRDRLSVKEFHISGICQSCQDTTLKQ